MLNGSAIVIYGLVTGRFRRKLLPIWPREMIADTRAALRFRLSHDDITRYNAVQELLYIGIILVLHRAGALRPGDLEAGAVLGADGAVLRLPGRAARAFPRHGAIVVFLVVHVALALLVPKTIGRDDDRRPAMVDWSLDARPSPTPPRIPEDDHGDPHPVASIFRPPQRIDQSVLDENRKLIEQIDRRKILRGALSLGALTMLTGCDVTDRGAVQSVLRAVSAWNDGVQAFLFDPNKLAPTYTEAQVLQAAALQRLLRDRGRQAGRRRELEARALPASSTTSGPGPRSRSTRCRSRS